MKKVLVAEDDPFLLKVYETKMVKAGFEVKIAHDGEEVFAILQTFQPDLMLLDLVMPKKDGFQVLTELKAKPPTKPFPIIVTSNLGQPEDKQKAIALGAKDYMVKSDVPISSIIEKVKETLGISGEVSVTSAPVAPKAA